MTVGTEVERYRPEAQALAPVQSGGLPWLSKDEYDVIENCSIKFARATAFPALKNPEHYFLAMMMLRDMGVSMFAGLSRAWVTPRGKLDFEVEVKLAAVQGRIPTFRYEFIEHTEKVCKIRARLYDSEPWSEEVFSIEDAQRAGLVKDDSAWQKYPKDMLFWKVIVRWLRHHAGPVLYGMRLPAIIDQQVREADAEVLPEERASDTGASPGAEGAQGTAAFPASAPPPAAQSPAQDSRKLLSDLARKMGKTKSAELLELLRLVFKEMGLTPPKNYGEVSPNDWQRAYDWLEKKYDPKTGQPRPKVAEGAAGQPSSGASLAPRTEVEPSAPLPTPEAEPVMPDAEAIAEPPSEDDPWQRAERGDPGAMIDYAIQAEEAFRKAGKPRRFVREYPDGSGNIFFVDPDGLVACGSVKSVDGKNVAASAVLATQDEKYKPHVASEGLRIMLAAAMREALDALEAGR